MSLATDRRSTRQADPGLRFGLLLLALVVGGLAVLVHGVLVTRAVSRLAADGASGRELLEALPAIVAVDALLLLAALVPLVLVVGRELVLRVVAPVHRMRVYLRALADGTATEPCRLRRTDLLRELCDELNAATESVRRANAEASRASDQRRAA